MKHLDAIGAHVLQFLSMLALVLLPVRSTMIAVGVLIVADLLTGVYASYKEGKPITSTGLKKTVGKMLMYQGAIVIGFVLETYLHLELPIVKVVAGIVGLTEGKSFFENLHRITGINFWNEALKYIQQSSSVSVKPDDKP